MTTNSDTPKMDSSSAERSGASGDPAERELPGYPHYPSEEDIMNPQNGFEKSKADIERLANSKRLSALDNSSMPQPGNEEDEEEAQENEDLEIVEGSEADVTPEDLIALGEKDNDQDMGEDETLGKQSRLDQPEDLQEESLDIPGSELDDANENIGEEDEENNYYSLGGDRHEGQEDDRS